MRPQGCPRKVTKPRRDFSARIEELRHDWNTMGMRAMMLKWKTGMSTLRAIAEVEGFGGRPKGIRKAPVCYNVQGAGPVPTMFRVPMQLPWWEGGEGTQ